ncbi:hypothetical protein Ahy_B02g057190 [Arachis hypogaea]|uniref:Borealin C-terminal domain-containing protein n=1 Tax=Arachis hypogaea TaxID=3818 RepID=A0A445ABF9_ARAHY|nr:hypothetical protein Ahy_B02g057190 [Arachis hypogaea]
MNGVGGRKGGGVLWVLHERVGHRRQPPAVVLFVSPPVRTLKSEGTNEVGTGQRQTRGCLSSPSPHRRPRRCCAVDLAVASLFCSVKQAKFPRRISKKMVKQSTQLKELKTQTQKPQFKELEIEVERQISAIRVVRDVDIERLLMELRLVRSEEQLRKPMLQVFEETLPNLSIVKDEGNGKFDVKWKEGGSKMSTTCGGVGRDLHASLFQRLSIAFPSECPSSVPQFGGFEYSSNTGRTGFLSDENLHFKDFVFEEPCEAQTLTSQEGLQTPNVSSQRLSVGMTPKTLRLPKPGEMLLSVHGSPLGVYKENNMEAIYESEED